MSDIDDPLGAFVPEGRCARQDIALGALAGLDFAAKDLFDVRGARASGGNPDRARGRAPAADDAAAVASCLGAGARLVGRTIMDEMAYSLSGQNPHYGTPTNPNAPGRLAGGSSCGSAAAVAGGVADFALGTDTGGSIRVPASYCGLYGLRPTHGAISLDGAMPLAPSFDTVGWFAREAEVLAQVGDVLLPPAPEDVPDWPTGLIVADDALALAAPAARDALAPWIARLQALFGAHETATLAEADDDLSAWVEAFRPLQAREALAAHGDWVAAARPAFGPEMQERWAYVASVTDAAAAQAATVRAAIRARLTDLTAGGRVLALPCAPDAAPLIDADADTLRAHRAGVLQLTVPASLAGLPQIALPLARVGGLPLALGLIGPPGGDRMLLSVAKEFDRQQDRDPGARFD